MLQPPRETGYAPHLIALLIPIPFATSSIDIQLAMLTWGLSEGVTPGIESQVTDPRKYLALCLLLSLSYKPLCSEAGFPFRTSSESSLNCFA